ncbi:MAG: repeat protein [Bacteroidota bacterium]|jgi:subtilisin-like proprotein convertase family protein|nr:repeat protein [Bacteroidota bacterium]
MKKIILHTVFLSFCFSTVLNSQPFFKRYDSVEVRINSSYITNPWAGGLNFAQNSAIDLNQDGIKDLFTFDKTGNKVRTFINHGTPNTVDYKYDASYESKFPKLQEWALLHDYNNDGKEDIFSYSWVGGGFDVYKNISTIAGGLAFQLVMTQQKSIYNPSRFSNASANVPIPDAGVSASWDGNSGTFASLPINVTSLLNNNWHFSSVLLNINHPNTDDLTVYLVNPCGNKIKLIKNAGGSGDNFTNTAFEPALTNIIGSVGNNTAPFSGSYAPEAGQAAWPAFLNCASPNGPWTLRVGDQTPGNTGTLTNWSISFYSPTNTAPYGLVNLFVSSVDIPAFSDIDNDGDTDVVTFAITGSFMEYHQNQSMEIYGVPDSLVFALKNPCWGYASEDAMSNDYTLHAACPYTNVSNPGIIENNNSEPDRSGERHSGSCQLCLDLDNDGDKEYVVGDVSYPSLTMLTNGGTPRAGIFSARDTAFPSNNSNTLPVDLTLFPCAYYLDVNNDGLKDLIVSPNAPNASENFNSQVFYQNTGTNTQPVFDYIQSNLLQDNMIEVGEGAYPVFFDYDNDGLKDLFIGNYGYYAANGFQHKIAQFKNTGTASEPKFELITRDYDGYDGTHVPFSSSSYNITNMVPAFGDLDMDGDADMIIGGADGRLHYFQNIATAGSIANFVLTQANLKNSSGRLIDVGDYAAPQIFDVDNDGKNDIIIGSSSGRLSYFHHTGSVTSSVPRMDSITNFLGKFRVNQPNYFTGYSFPFMFREAGNTKLLCGTQLGYLRKYGNIDGNLTGTFTLNDSTYLNIREGERTALCGADVNNDGLMDVVIGNYQGGVAFYKGVNSLVTTGDVNSLNHWNMEAFPNPSNNLLNIIITNDLPGNYRIDIFNMLGQSVLNQQFATNSITLNTSQLKQGIYLCKVSELNETGAIKPGSLVKRIVIQH